MKSRKVAEADSDIRLDRWFKRHLPTVPHGLIEKHLRRGLIRLDGKKTQASVRIVAGQEISFPEEFLTLTSDAPRPKTRKPVSDEDALKLQRLVLYRDEHVVVINKPAGLAVQGGTKQTTSVDDMLDALRFDAEERPKLVHRLDRDTSGVLVLARSSKVAAQLARRFASKDMEKIYVALVKGMPMPLKDTIRLPLVKYAKGVDSSYEAVEVEEDDGKPAITEYRVIEHLSDILSWVEMKPITGRTHQLRVHMAAIGHPIVGDGKYGGGEAFLRGMDFAPQLHLHARRIVIPGFYGKTLDVRAPLPPHMAKAVEMLGIEE